MPTNENLAALKGSFIPFLDLSQSRMSLTDTRVRIELGKKNCPILPNFAIKNRRWIEKSYSPRWFDDFRLFLKYREVWRHVTVVAKFLDLNSLSGQRQSFALSNDERLLRSRNHATMETWRHTSLFCWNHAETSEHANFNVSQPVRMIDWILE